MDDRKKTKEQLLTELGDVRQRVAELEGLEAARQELEEMHQRSVDIVNNIQVGLYIYRLEHIDDDRTLRMTFANRAAEAFTGVPARAVVDKTLDENFPGLRDKGVPQQYAAVVRSGEAIELEDVHYGDNRVIQGWFRVRAFPLPDHCVGIAFENITAQKVAEEALRKSEERYRIISETTSDYFYSMLVLPNGRMSVDWVGGAFEHITGYGEEEIRDLDKWMAVVNPDDLPRAREVARTVLSNRPYVFEYRIRTRNGEMRWLRDHTRPIWDEDRQRVAAVIGAVQDITDHKRMEAALEEAARVRTLVETAGAAAHEIGQPLQVVTASCELLQSKMNPGAPQRRLVEKIQTAAERIDGIVYKMRNIERYASQPYVGGEHIVDLHTAAVDPRGKGRRK